jgi:hypothetical protein
MSRDDPNQLVKSVVRSSSSQGSKAHPLRCIHNAIAPAIFSVNEDTLEKYRACSGPGWNSIQHLKCVYSENLIITEEPSNSLQGAYAKRSYQAGKEVQPAAM